MDWTLLLSVIPLLVSSFFASQLREPLRHTSDTPLDPIPYLEYLRLAYKEVRSNKALLYFFIFSFGISIFGDIEEFDQLYYKFVNLPVFAYGIMGFVLATLNSLGSFYAHRLKKTIWPYYGLPIIGALFLLFVGLFPGIPMIAMLLFAYFIVSPLHILINGKIQRSIKTISRATVTSVNSLLINFFGIVLTPLFGLISRVWNLPSIYTATAIFLLGFSVWTLLRKKIFSASSSP